MTNIGFMDYMSEYHKILRRESTMPKYGFIINDVRDYFWSKISTYLHAGEKVTIIDWRPQQSSCNIRTESGRIYSVYKNNLRIIHNNQTSKEEWGMEKKFCHSCGEEISGYSYEGLDGHDYCEDCFNDKYTYCHDCDEVIEISNKIYLERYEYDVCNNCLDNHYSKCDDCGDYVHNRNINNYTNINLCNVCVDNYRICDTCGNAIPEDDANYDDSNDEYYCDNCWSKRPSRFIHDYGHKPAPIFRKTDDDVLNPQFDGLEIEVDCGGEKGEIAEKVIDIMGGEDYVYCKNDGSLNRGFEIVTHPFTLAYHMSIKEDYKEMFNYLISNGYKSHDAGTCGLHIHVGRKYMGNTLEERDFTIAKILYVFERFWDNFVKLSRRTNDQLIHWASRYCFDDVSDLNRNLQIAKGRGRYYAVNLANNSTVEFRMFRGTLNIESFMATIQLISTIVDRCKTLSVEELQRMTFEELVATDYEELNNYINKRLNNGIELEEVA